MRPQTPLLPYSAPPLQALGDLAPCSRLRLRHAGVPVDAAGTIVIPNALSQPVELVRTAFSGDSIGGILYRCVSQCRYDLCEFEASMYMNSNTV